MSFFGTVYADENIDFSWQLANYGFGLSVSPNKISLEMPGELFNFFFDDHRTNIGVKLSPFNIRTILEVKETEESDFIMGLSFINLCVYYNCLSETDAILGPFSSLQYINIRNLRSFDYRDITVNLGIKYIYRTKVNIEKIDGNNSLLEMETGYRYNFFDGHKFYFCISVDLLQTFVMIGNIGKWLSPSQMPGSSAFPGFCRPLLFMIIPGI
jgi:hypothetical protein